MPERHSLDASCETGRNSLCRGLACSQLIFFEWWNWWLTLVCSGWVFSCPSFVLGTAAQATAVLLVSSVGCFFPAKRVKICLFMHQFPSIFNQVLEERKWKVVVSCLVEVMLIFERPRVSIFLFLVVLNSLLSSLLHRVSMDASLRAFVRSFNCQPSIVSLSLLLVATEFNFDCFRRLPFRLLQSLVVLLMKLSLPNKREKFQAQMKTPEVYQ